MTKLNQRVRLARNHAGLSRKELAAKVAKNAGTSCTAKHIEALEEGAVRVSSQLVAIAVMCGVCAEWLVYGDGPMLPGGVESEIAALARDFTQDESDMLDVWRLLPGSSKVMLMGIMRQLAKPMDPNYRALEARLEGQ